MMNVITPPDSVRQHCGYLLPEEIEAMIVGLRGNSQYYYGTDTTRNALLVLLMYRHGLRVSEVASLRWDQVSLKKMRLRIERLGKGLDGEHRLDERSSAWLHELKRFKDFHGLRPTGASADAVFDLKPRMMRNLVATAGRLAKIPFPVNPQMLRHSCGYHLAAKLRDPVAVQRYLGLKSPQSVMRYFQLNPTSVERVWDE